MSSDAPTNHVEIKTGTPEGEKLCTIVCSDKDVSNAGVVTMYQIGSSSPDSPLRVDIINETHWDIFLNRTVNHILDSKFTLRFLCVDDGDPKLTTIKNHLSFWVIDVNDHDPIFENKIYKVTLSEDVKIGSKVVTVFAYDNDSEQENAVVIYQIEDTQLADWFSVENESGSHVLSK